MDILIYWSYLISCLFHSLIHSSFECTTRWDEMRWLIDWLIDWLIGGDLYIDIFYFICVSCLLISTMGYSSHSHGADSIRGTNPMPMMYIYPMSCRYILYTHTYLPYVWCIFNGSEKGEWWDGMSIEVQLGIFVLCTPCFISLSIDTDSKEARKGKQT